jgi:hypothetical protein
LHFDAAKGVLHMMKFLSRSVGGHTTCNENGPPIALALVLAVAAGCAGNAASSTSGHESSTVSDADFGRLTASQTKPVDEARSELALARDELGRAKLGVVNDRHEGELAASDQATASADMGRAATETKIGKDSNEPGQMEQARDDTKTAQQGHEAADARVAYSQRLATSQAAEVTAAECKVDLMTEKVNLAKLRSLDEAAVPAAGKYDHAKATERVEDAQRAYDHATVAAAKASRETAAAKDHWQDMDKKQM